MDPMKMKSDITNPAHRTCVPKMDFGSIGPQIALRLFIDMDELIINTEKNKNSLFGEEEREQADRKSGYTERVT